MEKDHLSRRFAKAINLFKYGIIDDVIKILMSANGKTTFV